MKHLPYLVKLSLTTIIAGILSQPANAQTNHSEKLIQQPTLLSEWITHSTKADELKRGDSTSAQIPSPESSSSDEEEADIELIITGDGDNPLQERLDAPNQKIIIDRQEIERFNDATAGDVLRRLPGVVITGPFDENRDIRLRGFTPGFTQILIDGQRLPDGNNNRQVEVNRIPASAIERIEIIRTPTAGQNSQGVAGTINIVLTAIFR